MKVLELQQSGAAEQLRVVERPMPQARRGEIVIRMLAASLNYRDHQIVSGTYHVPFPLPLVPLSDGVGEVVQIGEGVSRFAVGDRVASTFWQRWVAGDFELADPESTLGGPIDGMLAEYVRLDEQGAVRVPDYLTHEESATLPCAAVTAWRALITEGKLRAGETVVIQGTGGVSMFALQFAALSGARTIVLSRSAAKLERVRALGASACIDVKQEPDWVAQVLALTDGRGADHIVDVVGPSGFVNALRALRIGGQLNIVGYLGGMEGQINPLMLLERQATLRGLQVGPRACFEQLNRALAASHMHPVVDRVLDWKELSGALHILRTGQHVGKIVLRF